MSTSRRHAFTLIELLVVVAIIALLVGLLIPSLQAARDTATNLKCMSNQRGLTLASLQYAGDWRGIPVQTIAVPETGNSQSQHYGLSGWAHRMAYAINGQPMQWSSTGGIGSFDERKGATNSVFSRFHALKGTSCPSVPAKSANHMYITPVDLYNHKNAGTKPRRFRDADFSPSSLVMHGDGSEVGIRSELAGGEYHEPMWRHKGRAGNETVNGSAADADRGDGYANFAFADGRVASYAKAQYGPEFRTSDGDSTGTLIVNSIR